MDRQRGHLRGHRYDSAGDTLLDSGAEIDPKSLAGADALLFWLKGGAAVDAPFS